MSNTPTQIRWYSSEWLEGVHAWISEQLVGLDIEVTGAITQPHVRPWATALRIPTDRGILWFKATTPALAHESAITRALSVWVPGRAPDVLAADPGRNWLLMSHGGEQLRTVVQKGSDRQLPRKLSTIYAGLQKDLVERVPAMLALNVPDCRLTLFAELYVRLLDNIVLLRIGEEEGLTAEEVARLQGLSARVHSIARELSEFGISETLQHDDLHWANVLIRDGRMIVFDWGDSSISHPFFSLVVLLRGAARDLDLPEDHPDVLELRDIYLAEWDLPLTRAETDRACALADALGRISRALTYARLLPAMEEPHRSHCITSVSGWLQEFLEAPVLG